MQKVSVPYCFVYQKLLPCDISYYHSYASYGHTLHSASPAPRRAFVLLGVSDDTL